MFSQTLSHKIRSAVPPANAKEVQYVKDSSTSFCRFCAKEKSNEDLLNLEEDKDTYNQYKKAIALLKIDFLDLSGNDKLPKTTCEPCYNSFDDMYIFFDEMKKAQIYLNTEILPIIENELSYLTTNELDSYSEDDTNSATELDSSKMSNIIIYIHEKTKTQKANEIQSAYQDTSLQDRRNSESNQSDIELDSEVSWSKPPSLTPCNSIPIFQDDTETKIEAIAEKEAEVQKDAHIEKEVIVEKEDSIHSWAEYKWCCCHCKEEFNSMGEVRSHSKITHEMCYGFSCSDCDDVFNTFNAFIEHVRQHKDFLRCYCQYCNMKFESRSDCFDHTITHWDGMQKICDLCGEIFPDQAAIERHKNMYKKKAPISRKTKRRKPKIVDTSHLNGLLLASDQSVVQTWESYSWSCLECCQGFPNIALLREHTQDVHNKCFSMKCMDCLAVMTSFKMFVNHVTQHRPCLKNHCQFCNYHIKDEDLMLQHIKNHKSSSQKPCEVCGQMFENDKKLLKHMITYGAPHVKGMATPEVVTCDICNKYCSTLAKFRHHRKIHDSNRERNFVCDACGKTFLTQSTLNGHVKLHNTKSEICEICKMAFHTKQSLKSHIGTHSRLRPFQCNECGKEFRTKYQIKQHLVSHSNIRPYACKECGKTFKFTHYLKNHLHQHTGVKPYACELCDRTFGNWPNCNKHMVRKHGVTLAKTKRTPQGRVAISRVSGKPKKLASGKKVKKQ